MEPLNVYRTPAIRYLNKALFSFAALPKTVPGIESREVDLSPAVPWVSLKQSPQTGHPVTKLG